MRKSIALCLACILSSSAALAQGWYVVNPTVKEGALTFITNDSGFIISDSLYITTDGGSSFQAQTLPPGPSLPYGLSLPGYSFPTPAIGYVAGELSPGTGYALSKTTDSGRSWSITYRTNYRLGPALFKSATEGIFIQFALGEVPQVGYTSDGLQHVLLKPPVPFNTQGQESTFLEWSDNGNWYVQYQGLVRSTDSGNSWTTVLPDDQTEESYGVISAACFHGNRGFAFADGSGKGFMGSFETTDAGATWPQVLPTSPYIPSTACSMPSDSVAYVIASDSNQIVLLKIELPTESVKDDRDSAIALSVTSNGLDLLFSTKSQETERTIEIYDVLGRKCTELPLGPMRTTTSLRERALQPGSYFAQLGNSVAKFIVW